MEHQICSTEIKDDSIIAIVETGHELVKLTMWTNLLNDEQYERMLRGSEHEIEKIVQEMMNEPMVVHMSEIIPYEPEFVEGRELTLI